MSRVTFANVFKVMNDEYGPHSKEDGEDVLNVIREENFFNENNDHDNFVSENEEFLPLHDFLWEEKQDEVLLFKDNFGDNYDDLKNVKNANMRRVPTIIFLLML